MTTRFEVDLLHPGRVSWTWLEWFLGDEGRRRLMFCSFGALGILLLVLVLGILMPQWRLSSDLRQVRDFKRDLTAAEGDFRVLKSNLQALGAETKRQIRWAELLTAFSQQIPPTLKLQRVEHAMVSVAPGPGQQQPQQQQQPPPPPESTLQVEAVMPLRPGSPHLIDAAQFMAGLMRAPAVNRRFQLKSWEIKPPAEGSPEGSQLLQLRITLRERSQ